MRYLNEYSLRRRLRDLLREHAGPIKELFDVSQEMADEITDARNALTHLPLGTDHSSIDVSRLYFLCELCLTLLEFCLLQMIGFPPSQIYDMVHSKQIYRRQALQWH